MDTRYFANEKLSKKSLRLKNARSWKIIRVINNKAYKVDILQNMRNASLTPFFHLL